MGVQAIAWTHSSLSLDRHALCCQNVSHQLPFTWLALVCSAFGNKSGEIEFNKLRERQQESSSMFSLQGQPPTHLPIASLFDRWHTQD